MTENEKLIAAIEQAQAALSAAIDVLKTNIETTPPTKTEERNVALIEAAVERVLDRREQQARDEVMHAHRSPMQAQFDRMLTVHDDADLLMSQTRTLS